MIAQFIIAWCGVLAIASITAMLAVGAYWCCHEMWKDIKK